MNFSIYIIQFPQHSLKPLTNDNVNKNQLCMDAESSLKYKLSTESQQKIKDFENKEMQHKRNSDVHCMDSYKNATISKGPNQTDSNLFSGLNQTVKVLKYMLVSLSRYWILSFFFLLQSIDFNNINTNDVSIHKRNREKSPSILMSPPSDPPDSGQAKKKKYKIVPNVSSISPAPSDDSAINEIPKDRKQLLSFVSCKLEFFHRFFLIGWLRLFFYFTDKEHYKTWSLSKVFENFHWLQ